MGAAARSARLQAITTHGIPAQPVQPVVDGAQRAIADLQLQCPQDVSVVSIDDFAWANAFRPRLTTVAQPVAAMGETAMHMLLGRMRGDAPAAPQLAVMAPTLMARDSCCAPRPRGAA